MQLHANISSSPIQKLAPELLSEIFLRCLSEDETAPMRYVSRAPLLLGRVCSVWRTISYSTAALWTHLIIGDNFSQPSPPDFAKDVIAMNAWIERSWSHSLFVAIYLGRSTFQMHRSHLTDRSLGTLLMTVKSQSQRWRRLDVTIPSNFEEILFSPLRMKDVAILEHASIRTWESSSNHARNELQFSLSAAPRLECVVLRSNIRVTFDGPVQHSLKHLTFHRDYDVKTHQADLGACLKQYPFLQTLSYPLHSSSLPKTLPAILNHTHIQSLNLRIHMGCDLGLLFHHLILPALTDLVLDIEDDWIPKKNWPHLLTLLKHSRPPLTSLTLIGFPTMERNLIECLKCTTDLRKLTACAVGCTDATLEALTVNDSDPSSILCPRL